MPNKGRGQTNAEANQSRNLRNFENKEDSILAEMP